MQHTSGPPSNKLAHTGLNEYYQEYIITCTLDIFYNEGLRCMWINHKPATTKYKFWHNKYLLEIFLYYDIFSLRYSVGWIGTCSAKTDSRDTKIWHNTPLFPVQKQRELRLLIVSKHWPSYSTQCMISIWIMTSYVVDSHAYANPSL